MGQRQKTFTCNRSSVKFKLSSLGHASAATHTKILSIWTIARVIDATKAGHCQASWTVGDATMRIVNPLTIVFVDINIRLATVDLVTSSLRWWWCWLY